MKDPPTVNIHPAHKNDLIALARIHISALRCYKYIKVMYRAASHWNAINAMLESRYANTDYQIKIAVTGKSYCVAGWMSYSGM